MEVGGSQGWGVVGSSTGWGVGTADRPPVAAPSSSKDLREDSRGRFGGRLTSAMLEKALSGGGGAASGTVAGSSTSSTSATGAIPDVAPSTHLTTPLPSGSRTNPPPTGSALAEQLAVVAGAAHSYEQLMEITRGWHLPLKAVDLAWTTAQRSREKGKGRASDTSLTAPAEVEYLGPPLNNPALWNELPLLARFIVGLPTALAQLRASPAVSDTFANEIISTLFTRAAQSTISHEVLAHLAVGDYSAYLSSLSIPPWPISPVKVLVYFVSRLPATCRAHAYLTTLTPKSWSNPFPSFNAMRETRSRLAAAQKLTKDLWDALEPPIVPKEPSVLNEIVRAARNCNSSGTKRTSGKEQGSGDDDENDITLFVSPPPPRVTTPPNFTSSSKRPPPAPPDFQPFSRNRNRNYAPPNPIPPRNHSNPPALPPSRPSEDRSEGEAEFEAAAAELRRQLGLLEAQRRSRQSIPPLEPAAASIHDTMFEEPTREEWDDRFEATVAPSSLLANNASHSAPHTFLPPISAPLPLAPALPPIAPSTRQQPSPPTTTPSEGPAQAGEGLAKPRRKRRKIVVKTFEEFCEEIMTRK